MSSIIAGKGGTGDGGTSKAKGFDGSVQIRTPGSAQPATDLIAAKGGRESVSKAKGFDENYQIRTPMRGPAGNSRPPMRRK